MLRTFFQGCCATCCGQIPIRMCRVGERMTEGWVVIIWIVYKCPQPITCKFLRQVSFTFGADVVSKFLNRHDLDLICRAHQVRLAVKWLIEYIKHIVLHHKCESAMAMSAVSRCGAADNVTMYWYCKLTVTLIVTCLTQPFGTFHSINITWYLFIDVIPNLKYDNIAQCIWFLPSVWCRASLLCID